MKTFTKSITDSEVSFKVSKKLQLKQETALNTNLFILKKQPKLQKRNESLAMFKKTLRYIFNNEAYYKIEEFMEEHKRIF